MNNRNLKNIPCNLLPYVKENVISFQSEEQKLGWQITNFHIPDIWKFSKGENVRIAVLDTGIDLDHGSKKHTGKIALSKKESILASHVINDLEKLFKTKEESDHIKEIIKNIKKN